MLLMIEVGVAILVASFVLTLAIKSLFLQDAAAQPSGRAAALGGSPSGRSLLAALGNVPRDVFSVLFFVLLVIAVLFAVWYALSQAYGRLSTFASRAAEAVPSLGALARGEDSVLSRVTVGRLKYTPLRKDYSVNRPPWCLACQRRPAAAQQPPAAARSRRMDRMDRCPFDSEVRIPSRHARQANVGGILLFHQHGDA
jgi:hypothetical protein